MSGRVIRLSWLIPVVLAGLAANQAKVAWDLNSTWRNGVSATAQLVAYERSNRADVTYGYVGLVVSLADGTRLEEEKLSLPHSLLPRLEGVDSVEVKVRQGAAQDVVIASIMPAHFWIAISNAGMSLAGILLFLGVAFVLARKRQDRAAD